MDNIQVKRWWPTLGTVRPFLAPYVQRRFQTGYESERNTYWVPGFRLVWAAG